MPSTKAANHLSGQLISSGTSPALNYGEAQSTESRKDFIEVFLRSEYSEKIRWGGNYDSHKDFMHIEYVEDGKFKIN